LLQYRLPQGVWQALNKYRRCWRHRSHGVTTKDLLEDVSPVAVILVFVAIDILKLLANSLTKPWTLSPEKVAGQQVFTRLDM
jgi:hypothetical protein